MHNSLGHLEITIVSPVATFQGDSTPCLVRERHVAGEFFEVRGDTLYHPDLSIYVHLSPEGMAKARNGQPLRVSSCAVS